MAIKLATVEMTRPLPTIQVDERYSSVWILVRIEGVPLGYVKLPQVKGQLTQERLAREILDCFSTDLISHRLYRYFIGCPEHWQQEGQKVLNSPPREPDCPKPFVSVLVCTRDRTEMLKNTLSSLAALDYPDYEVIVVDNCPSTNDTRDLTAEFGFRYVLEKRPGLDRARNRGIAESRGEIIAFIDDDAVVDSGWLNGLVCGFSCPDTVCVTGLVLPAELETRAQELFEACYGGFGRGFRRWNMTPDAGWKYAPYWLSIGTGCNMAIRREVFDKVGLFDVALDVGTPTGGAGDLDMFHRIARAGYTIAYRPEALVYHRHREGMDELHKLLRNYGKSFTAFLTKCFIHEPDARFLLFKLVLKWYRLWFVKRLMRQIKHRNGMPVKLILTEAAGSFGGPGAYFRSLRWSRFIEDSHSDREMCKSVN